MRTLSREEVGAVSGGATNPIEYMFNVAKGLGVFWSLFWANFRGDF